MVGGGAADVQAVECVPVPNQVQVLVQDDDHVADHIHRTGPLVRNSLSIGKKQQVPVREPPAFMVNIVYGISEQLADFERR